MIDIIRILSQIPGVSGDEAAVREWIAGELKPHAQSIEVDPLGNLIVFKRGQKRARNKIMLSAHMDEVGLVITHIEDDGQLRCAPVGGIDTRVATGRAVLVGENRLPGVIGGKAVHHLDGKEQGTPPSWEDIYIDIGAKDSEQAAELITPGDRAVYVGEFGEHGEGYIVGRALDDRAGCAMLIELIRSPLAYDCHFAFTVLEETGCTGGGTAASAICPDIGIAVETTAGADIPGSSGADTVCKLGLGPVVSYMDRATVYDKSLYDIAFKLAADKGIPCQTKSLVAGGNEAQSVQAAGSGARVMAVSLPCRYLHSPSLVIDKSDLDNTVRLLGALIERLGGAEL